MPKRGSAYEEIVGSVCAALEPGAKVRVSTNKLGPDGQRDIDVSVRGTRNGKPYFALVECKDWKRKVGIAVVDALHSKSHDLEADLSVIYSNSGFTGSAYRKATRLGISLCSAMKAGDRRVRIVVERDFRAHLLAVDRYSVRTDWRDAPANLAPFAPTDIAYGGNPLLNWLSEKSRAVLSEHAGRPYVYARYVFKEELEFTVHGAPVKVTGIALEMNCSSGWVRQSLRENVSLGSYDFIKRQVIIPDKQYWSLGPVDNEAWVPCEPPPPDVALEPNSFRLHLTLLRPIAPIVGASTPPLDDHVAGSDVSFERAAA